GERVEAGDRRRVRGVPAPRPQHGELPRPRQPQDARAAVSAREPAGGGDPLDRRRLLRAVPRAARGHPMSGALTSELIEVDADPEAFYELSLAEGGGDGAPLLPPTDERVAARLAATPLPADHVLGDLPPRYGTATVELAAINATMAGVAPEAF